MPLSPAPTDLDFLVDFLEQLRPDIVVERCFAEAPPRLNRTPVQWKIRNDQLLQQLEKRLEERQTWQGRRWG
jgi:radical SAM superfamily enzyme